MLLLLMLATLGSGAEWRQEPRPVPLSSPVRVVKRGDDRLKGITAVDVLVEALSADSARCGLGKGSLQQLAVKAMSRARLAATVSEKDRSWFYTVRVTTTTVRSDDRCATALRTQLVTQVDGVPEVDRYATMGEWGSLLIGEMILIEQSALVESAAADHADRLQQALHDQLAAIGNRVRAANR